MPLPRAPAGCPRPTRTDHHPWAPRAAPTRPVRRYRAPGRAAAALPSRRPRRGNPCGAMRRGRRGCGPSAPRRSARAPPSPGGSSPRMPPDDRLPPFHGHAGDGDELITVRVLTGGLDAEDRKRRLAPGKGRSGRRCPQVVLHDLGLTFQDGHHANARPPTSPRASLFWTARTSLRASRRRRRRAGSRALGSR